MSTLELSLYNMLKADLKISDERAKKYIEVLEELQESKIKELSSEYRSIFKEDLVHLEKKLEVKIADTKSDMIKWFFTFFVTLILMILGLYATILLKQ